MKLGVLLGALALSLAASALVPAEAEAAHRHDRYCRHDRSRAASRYRNDRYDRYDRYSRSSRYDDRYYDRRYSRYDDRYYGSYDRGDYGYDDYDYGYRYSRPYYGYGPRISVRPYVYLSPGRYRYRHRYWQPRLGVRIGGRHLGLYLGF